MHTPLEANMHAMHPALARIPDNRASPELDNVVILRLVYALVVEQVQQVGFQELHALLRRAPRASLQERRQAENLYTCHRHKLCKIPTEEPLFKLFKHMSVQTWLPASGMCWPLQPLHCTMFGCECALCWPSCWEAC